MKIKMLILILPSFFKFSNFSSVTPIKYIIMNLFSVKDFSATTWLRIQKFDTKLDSEKLYCVKKTATYCKSVPLFVHVSFFPMKISVADFSVPIWASVFKCCVHLQVGLVYCVNGNNDAKAHFVFPFNFFLCHSYITHMDVFRQSFSATTWFRTMKFCVHFQVGKV